MAASLAAIILLPLLFCLPNCCAEDTHAILLRVVDAIERLIGFYKARYQNMNLDGIFGLKVLEGQVYRILNEHDQGQHASLSPQVVQQLDVILKESKWIGDRAIATVRADDEQYFKNLEYVITKPWTHLKPHRRVQPASRWEIPVYQSSINTKLEEKQSDKCMMEITLPNKRKMTESKQPHCNLSETCGLIMTKRGFTDYSITHQLLWTALAEKGGCKSEIDSLLKSLGFTSTENMQEEFCTNNYYEMLAVVHVFMSGRVKGHYQDLFMEQQFVCPSLGFFEFLKKDYLDQILSWQHSTGCFGVHSENDSQPENQGLLKQPPKGKNVNMFNGHVLKKKQIQQQMRNVDINNHVAQPILHKEDTHFHEQAKVEHQFQKPNGVPSDQQPLLAGRAANMAQIEHPKNQLPHRFNLSQNPDPVVNHFNKAADHQDNLPLKFQHNIHLGHQINEPGILQEGKTISPHGLDASARKPNFKSHIAAQVPEFNRGQIPPVRERPDGQMLHQPMVPDLDRKMLDAYEAGQGAKRKLLVEKDMSDGCLSHKTGVAGGALAMYLRYLIDPGPLDLFAPHNFFPEGPRGLLGNENSYRNVMHFLGRQVQNSLIEKNNTVNKKMVELEGHVGDKGNGIVQGEGRDEEEEEEDEDREYEDRDEMYPDAGEGAGQQHEQRVVHFGANDDTHYKNQKKEDYDNKDENNEYANENEDEEEEEEGGDYIKRLKGDDEDGVNAVEEDKNEDDDTEYTYYDDNDNSEQGIIKRHKPQALPHNGVKIRSHNRHKPHPPIIDNVVMDHTDSPPTRAVVFLLSATSLILVIFMYRFIKKRRIHIRPHNRSFFKL